MTDRRPLERLDRPEVTRVLFYPRTDPPDRPVPLRVRRVDIQVAQGIALGGRLHRAKLDGPNLLFFHGNGELASDYDGISLLYTSLGINLLIVDYRGYGTSDGQPSASAMLDDALTVFEQAGPLLLENELKARPLFVMGRSLGSAAALEVAQHAGDGIDGLILESGFARTRPLLVTLGLRQELEGLDEAQDGFGNLDKIAKVTAPTLIIHGEQDRLIPVDNGRALFEHAAAPHKQLALIPDAGHNDLLFTGQRQYFEALRGFIFGGRG
jgi:pimeloyl-ACP methyl ester carboxylesterase